MGLLDKCIVKYFPLNEQPGRRQDVLQTRLVVACLFGFVFLRAMVMEIGVLFTKSKIELVLCEASEL